MKKIKFNSILNDNELTNIDLIKEYLVYSLRRRMALKDNKFYINICKIYDYYPNTIKEILDNISTLGYYKDYFKILYFSRNLKLDEYILDIIVNQIKSDIRNYYNKKKITTLGKWLPRENSKINKKINFIDKFTFIFYPDTPIYTARKKYRKLKSLLNEEIGTLEKKMCAKQYQQINFDKVSPLALKNNMSHLMKHDECKDNFDTFLFETLSKCNLNDFIRQLFLINYEKEMVETVWNLNKDKYLNEISHLNKIISNTLVILDLSKDTFNYDMQNFVIGIGLLVDSFSELVDNKIICNYETLKLSGSFLDKTKQIMTYIGPCRAIEISKYYEMNKECKNILIVSSKDILDMESLKNKEITIMQIKFQKLDYELIYYDGNDLKKYKKINKNDNTNNLKKNIKTIVNESPDLIINENKIIYYIIILIFFVFCFLCYMNIITII